MGLRNEQCEKVCRIIDDVLANRPTERDSLIVAVQKAFKSLERLESSSINCSEFPNNWIPCSERLPEKEGRYLVWAVVSFTPGHVDEPCEYQQTTIASYFYVRRSSWHGENIEKVIAWMPLPEPYGGEQE